MGETKVAAPPLVSRINLVYLYARDVPRSAAFYRDVLELPMEVEESAITGRRGACRATGRRRCRARRGRATR